MDKQEEIKLNFEDNKDGKYDNLFIEEDIENDTINSISDTLNL